MLRCILIAALVAAAGIARADVLPLQCDRRNTALRMFQHKDTCLRPLGLEPNAEFSPWTHKPHCRRGIDPVSKRSYRFCVHTKANSTSELGISIITTPGIAKHIAKNLNLAIYDETQTSHSMPYVQRKSPGKGIGLFATRHFKAGDILIKDLVTFVVHRDAYEYLSDDDRHWLQWRGVMQLPRARQKLTLDLAKSRGGDAVDDIVNTNGIGLTYVEDDEHGALLPLTSRMNHACRPNVLYRPDEKMGFVEVFALRDISVGDELTLTYSLPEMTRDQRQRYLFENWGFRCSCDLCSSSSGKIADSDRRLARISEISGLISKPSNKPRDVLRLANEMLGLYDKEGLVMPKPAIYDAAAKAALYASEYEAALKHSHDAAELWKIVTGSKSAEYRSAIEMLDHVKAEYG